LACCATFLSVSGLTQPMDNSVMVSCRDSLVKVFYFINLIVQLFALNIFLGADYHLYGLRFLNDLFAGRDVPSSSAGPAFGVGDGSIMSRFPRVSLCDFNIQQSGGTQHSHTVQCVLSINLFNEKIYAFLWFWYAFVAFSTVASFARWLWAVGWRCNRIKYVRRHLKVGPSLCKLIYYI